MPQEFQVLQCYQCETFQVHQVKKTTKWQCKLCGEKQSLKKVYGRGSGQECRCHVQKLNTMRGEVQTKVQCFQYDDMNKTSVSKENENNIWNNQSQMTTHSEDNKWNMFVDVNNDSDSDDENFADSLYTTDASMFQRGKKRKRINKQSIKGNYDEIHELKTGTTKNWLNKNCISDNDSSQNLHQANEDVYGSGIKEFPSQSEELSESADFDTKNQPYVNEESSSFKIVTENDSPCAKRKYNRIDCGVSTTLSSKWSSFVTSGENRNLCTPDDSLSDNTHNQINKKMFSNKYMTYIEDFEEIENTDSGLLSNQTQGYVRPLNLAHVDNGPISDEGDVTSSAIASNLLKQKFEMTSEKPINLEQSKSKWSSNLPCKPQSVGSSYCVSFDPKPCGVNKPLKFSVGDLTEEDFDL